jgi:Tfp pilus assembly protein PilF
LALKLRGDIALHRKLQQIEQAEARYREALALAEVMGMRPLQAHCHAGLAQVHAAAGNTAKAREEFRAANQLFHAMKMNSFSAETENESARIE